MIQLASRIMPTSPASGSRSGWFNLFSGLRSSALALIPG
jgi:hypothetical protein